MNTCPQVVVCGGFDNIRPRHLRFLEEASRLGTLTVLLWPDEALQNLTGQTPKFPLAERRYFLDAVRYVNQVIELGPAFDPRALSMPTGLTPDIWVDDATCDPAAYQTFCESLGIRHVILPKSTIDGFPEPQPHPDTPGRKKVVVTGCYDWFHSGHIRFFEEASAYGDLYVIVGHDANIRLLKGEGHPLFPDTERRYTVGSIKYVKQALISSGEGWVDADPEIRCLKPHIYAVNEDGDRGGKRDYCTKMGIEYLVLKRTPAPGLPRRTSTDLRGF